MYFGNGFYMGGMHGLWWLFWIVLIGALVYAAWGRPSGPARFQGDTARSATATPCQRRDRRAGVRAAKGLARPRCRQVGLSRSMM